MRFDPKERATCWSLTINNPVESDFEAVKRVENVRGWSIVGQEECGTKDGTPHLQLCLKTDYTRGSAVKKHFPRAHIEKARNKEALLDYVQKPETAKGEVMIIENKWISFKDVRTLFFKHIASTTHANDVYDIPETLDFTAKMRKWDDYICTQIAEGIECGDIGVNPSYRSQVGKYWDGFLEHIRRQQTDRQTEETSVSSINIPTIHASYEQVPYSGAYTQEHPP